MPRPCAHSIIGAISWSLTPFSATMLILTPRPACWAASIPFSTVGRSPRRVIALKLAGSRLSIETLTRRTPAAASSAAKRASCDPFVVSVSSCSAPLSRWRDRLPIKRIRSRRTSGSPPVSLILRVPRAMKTLQSRSSSSSESRSRRGRNSMSSAMQ